MKPILFNTETVRAILENQKTVTRRAVKPQHLRVLDSPYHEEHPETPDKVLLEKLCEPPYHPGDILYVRETWGDYSECCPGGAGYFLYRADYSDGAKTYEFDGHICDLPRWRPSIHMPREAARIFLWVMDVRVQRLKDVTEGDVRAEGFDSGAEFIGAILKMYPDCTEESWMWAIEFERISKERAMKNGS